MPTYVSTYTVSDQEISQSIDGTVTLGSIVGGSCVYMEILKNNTSYKIDLSQYMLREKNLDLTQTLSTVASQITDLQIAGYASNNIPTLDPNTGGIINRISTYDAIAANDLTVAWTSIGNPTVRNDVYQRATMNDLVLSSAKRDLCNCLVSVNGVFHKTYLYNKELYVEDGFSNIKRVRRDEIGVYDTGSVGGHTILPIHNHNIDASNRTPHSGVTLTFPDSDFTDKSLLLVIGGYLHVLDGTYKILSKNRVVVDICKIDLINEFIHNPNTIYTKGSLKEAIFEDRLEEDRFDSLTVYDKIMHYLWNEYPKAKKNHKKPVNVISFNPPDEYFTVPVDREIIYYLTNIYPWSKQMAATKTSISEFTTGIRGRKFAPTVTDDICSFLERYPSINRANNVMMVDYEWTTKYETLVSDIGSVPSWKFKDPVFVYNTLLSKHSFFVVVNNPRLYKKKYQVTKTHSQSQFVHYGKDTPRGTFLYNNQHAVPYVLYSNDRRYEHNFSIRHVKLCLDAYKTAIDPPAIPSPLYDIKGDTNYPTHLTELYSGEI